ncbi:MAG TPA: phospholipase D family protein [Methylomirabilota bacterium]|nr:phospholipase D family protein [Methylomirabilota bacterium]
MLDVKVFGDGKDFGQALAADLPTASQLSVAVAFAKESALSTVEVESWCRPGRRLQLLAGTDFALTELQVLRRLEATGFADCRIYHSIAGQVFHPKIYILESTDERIVYVGSSNLTRGGLLDNVEANVRMRARRGTPAIEQPRDVFDGCSAASSPCHCRRNSIPAIGSSRRLFGQHKRIR